jgi:TP901 family phage tail tape measure protein
VATGNDLAVAYVQLLPSFDKFYARLRAEAGQNASKFEKFGADAGKSWSKGFAANAQATPTATGAAPTGGGASAASEGSSAATAIAAGAGAEFGSIEAAAAASGVASGAAFAKGFTSAGAGLSAVGTGLTAGVTIPLAAVGVLSAKAAIDFETAFAGVRKTVDATEAEFAQLSAGIRELATGAPIPVEGIARIVELGGQLGIPNDQLLSFADTVTRLSVSLEGLDPETAALQIAQFSAITGMPADEIDNFGAALTDLGNNFATTEGPILQFALRLAGQGKIIGLTTEEILAFSTALASVGIMPEAGGTAFSRVFQRINDAVGTGSAELETFSAIAGMTSQKFTELFDNKPFEAINAFTIGLGKLSSEAATTTPILEELGLADVRVKDGVQRLAGSQDQLGKAYDVSARAIKENTALIEESEKRYATTASQVEIAKNRLNDVGIELGNSITPALADLLEAAKPLIDGVGVLAEAFGKLPQPVQTAAIATGVLAASVGPLSAFAGLLSTAVGGAITALVGFTSSAGAAAVAATTTASSTATMSTSMALATTTTETTAVALTATGAAGRAAGVGMSAAGAAARAVKWASIAAGVALVADALFDVATGAPDAKAALDELLTIDAGASITQQLDKLGAAGNAKSKEGLFGFINSLADPVNDVDLGGGVTASIKDLQRGLQELISAGEFEQAEQQIENLRSVIDRPANQEGGIFGEAPAAEIETTVEQYTNALELARASEERAGAAADEAAADVGAFGGALDGASIGAAEFVKQLKLAQVSGKLASVGIDAAAAAAERYLTAVENAGAADDQLAAGIGFSQTLREARENAGLQESEEDISSRARKIAQEQDRIATEMRDAALSTDGLTDAIDRLNPALRILEIESEAAAAAANGFRESIENSSSLDDTIGSTLSLGDAYKTARKSIKGLPADLDLAAVSLGKLKPRQQRAVEGILALGEATTDYLATLIESGKTDAEVRNEASRLRDEYVKTFRQLGLNEDQIKKYLDAMGLTPEQVETAIEVSGIEESKAKLQAYAQLLEGRIPANVASTVIGLVEAGDFEGAADQLAALAATNPIDIPVGVSVDQPAITAAQDALDQLEKDTLDLPEAFDVATAAFGGYTEDQERGLQAVIDLGDKAQDVISSFIAAGDFDGAREAAAGLRAEIGGFISELTGLDPSSPEVERYIDDLLQLSGADVETNIRLAGLEEAITQVQLYMDLLAAAEIGIPQEVLNLINLNVADKNWEGVAAILEQFTNGLPEFQIPGVTTPGLSPGASPPPALDPANLPPIDYPVAVDVADAENFLATWVTDNETGEPLLVPATTDTAEADLIVAEWRQTEEGKWVIVDTGANPQLATAELDAWRRGEVNVPAITPIDGNVGAAETAVRNFQIGVEDPAAQAWKIINGDTNPAQKAVDAFGLALSTAAPFLLDIAIDVADFIDNVADAFGVGIDVAADIIGAIIPGFATGGYVSGPGTGTSDSIMANLSNGEYVMTAAATRSLGVDFLDKLNKGYVPGFAMGGLVGDTPLPAISAGGGVNVDYTVVEAKSRPSAEDLVRVTNSAVFLGASV